MFASVGTHGLPGRRPRFSMKLIQAKPGRDITAEYHKQRRTAAARQELIRLTIKKSELVESQEKSEEFWSERTFIEERMAELRQVISEAE